MSGQSPFIRPIGDEMGDNPFPGQWAGSVWGIEAGPFVPFGGMERTLLHKVRLKVHEAFARELTGTLGRFASAFASTHPLFTTMQALAPFAPTKRRRRKTARGAPEQWTQGLLADVAVRHDDAVKAGQSGIEAVSGAYQISYSAARKVVAKAKAEGLLPPSGRGEVPRPLSSERRAGVEKIVEANLEAIKAGRKAIRAKAARATMARGRVRA